jgi:ubiquinone/menaquinone biosynthesis C-methylase UbiE
VHVSKCMESLAKRFLRASLRLFFKHLYTTFAWAYDLVAWTSSLGQWKVWQSTALEILPDGNILELGHGPGHLLLKLAQNNQVGFGVDASAQMGCIASKRLHKHGYKTNVIQALGQRLPLMSGHFSSVLSTFPSEYIIDPDTLSEVWRVLQPGGAFVIVSSARISGRNLPDRFAAWLYRITGQSGKLHEGWAEPLERLGFSSHLDYVQLPRATVLRVIARKNVTRRFAPSSTQA